MPVERKHLLGEPPSDVREAIRDGGTGSAHLAPSRFHACTMNAKNNKPRPRRGRAVNSGQRSQGFPFGVPTYSSDALVD